MLSLAAGLAPQSLWPQWRMVNEPLHSAIEAAGALAAVIMSFVLMPKGRDEGDWRSTVLAAGFMGMGVLDGIHAASSPGQEFVLLHDSAVLAGGIGFGLVFSRGWSGIRRSQGLHRCCSLGFARPSACG